MSNSASVAVIGLGLLGSALARRLRAQDWQVFGYDLDIAAGERLSGSGIEICATPAAAVASARTVLLSLPHAGVSQGVVREILPILEPGTLILDTTTGTPAEMVETHRLAAEAGAGYFDCSVCGSSTLAERGEAVLLVGGEAAAVSACRPLLEALASRWIHVGPVGDGVRMKLVVNLVLGLNRAVFAEGMAFGESLGFTGRQILEVLQAGPARSEVMETKGERMVTSDFEPQARLRQHRKDVGIILSEAQTRQIRLPLTEIHSDLLDRCIQAGWGDWDNSAIIQLFRERNRLIGIPFPPPSD